VKRTIVASRIVLNPLGIDHVDELYWLESDLDVNRYQGYPPMTQEEAKLYCHDSEESWSSETFPNWQEFAIERDGVFLGRIGFQHEGGAATVWYALLPGFQGQGFAREALTALINDLRGLGVERMEANCSVENVRSGNLLLCTGFEEIESDEADLRKFKLEY
jgi:RimJ/RimL family protein N-acetyltransferase